MTARQIIEEQDPDVEGAFSDLEGVSGELLREKAEKMVSDYFSRGNTTAKEDLGRAFARLTTRQLPLASTIRDARENAISHVADDALYDELFAGEGGEEAVDLKDAVYDVLYGVLEELIDETPEMAEAVHRMKQRQANLHAPVIRSSFK